MTDKLMFTFDESALHKIHKLNEQGNVTLSEENRETLIDSMLEKMREHWNTLTNKEIIFMAARDLGL